MKFDDRFLMTEAMLGSVGVTALALLSSYFIVF